jgi:hypothetical protein
METAGTISVIYFPLYPAHARLEEAQFIPILLCSYLPLGLVGWLGLRGGWHFIRSVFSVPQEPYPTEAFNRAA